MAAGGVAKIGVLGSGDVGQTLARGLASKGIEVMIGTRSPDSEKIKAFLAEAGDGIVAGTFEDTAKFGEVVILACKGEVAESVVALSGGNASLGGKTVLDVTNPLTEREGGGIALERGWDTSLGEGVQKAASEAHVVKCWSIINCHNMIDPPVYEGGVKPDMFICGNSADAKAQVTDLLQRCGWEKDNVLDFGDISYARTIEPFVVAWVKVGMTTGKWNHAFKILRNPQ